MRSTAWMLELGRTNWRLVACRDEAAPELLTTTFAEAEFIDQADAIHAALAAAGYQGEPVIVAVESRWCLAATLPVSRSHELRDRKSMLYRFEECIPWSVEDCVIDYTRAGKQALLVAVPTAPLAAFFGHLESLGVVIQSIAPLALLAACEHAASERTGDAQVVAFEKDEWVDLLWLDGGQFQKWSTVPAYGNGLSRELQQSALDCGNTLNVVGYGLSERTTTAMQTSVAVALCTQDVPPGLSLSTMARTAAVKIARGAVEAPIELKRDAFGRSGLSAALRPYAVALQVAVLLLLATLAGSFAYRGHVAAREADALSQKQVQIFGSVFPNTKVPVGVKGRLESERDKLKGLQGGEESLPNSLSATVVLRDLLAALPTDRRFVLLEIRIEEGRLFLDGEVREHGDAELIAQRLRTQGFEVASPRTQRFDDKRVSLRITATRLPARQIASRKKR